MRKKMEIKETVKEHLVVDYDFMFTSGNKLTMTVDVDLGDTVAELADRYLFNTVPRPGMTEDEDAVEAETLEVFKAGLAAVSTCKRKQRQATEEEVFDLRKTVHALAKSVQ
jgi:hypothetical protein